ncbi:MAG: response regulator [Methylococcaceae bacterium]|nr:response regulator [Methylococcaceae bacterium]
MNAPILVVDDEPDMCWAMESILKSQGYEVVTVLSGEEACYQLANRTFGFVFMDAKLPDMDGLDVVRRARAIAPDQVRAVLVSGYHYHDDPVIRQAIDEGVICGFLAKPFTHSDLLKALPKRDTPDSR